MKKRLGNDLSINWAIYQKSGEQIIGYDLTGKDITLSMILNGYKTIDVPDFTVSGNTIHWDFKGKDQKFLGEYTTVLSINKGKDGMITFDVKEAFILVPWSCMEGKEATDPDIEISSVDLVSTLEVSSGGDTPSPGSEYSVLYVPQYLTAEQQTQARTNIGAGTSNFSGNYNDLSNKPTIPSVSNKADKVSEAVAGNFAGLDANGNLVDSGSKATDFLTSHQDISGKQDKAVIVTTGGSTQELANNTEYRYTSAIASLTISAPASLPDDYCTWLVFVSGATATSLTYPVTWKWSGDDVTSNSFVPRINKTYNIGIWYDGVNINAVVRGI